MARHLHLDPLSGIAGDMFLGLLVELGLDEKVLTALPERLGLDGVEVACSRAMRGALMSGRVVVTTSGMPADTHHHHEHRHGDHGHHHHGHDHHGGQDHHHGHDHAHSRNRVQMRAAIEGADLPPRARARALDAIDRLFAAEAKVHGQSVEEIHLHEAGGDDALVDIAGTCLGLDTLGIASMSCSTPLPTGGGTVNTAHGVLCVPAPAVTELLAGVETVGGPVEKELITPTGAALLRAVVDCFGPAPSITVSASGFGGGTRNDPQRPNVVRGMLGETRTESLERDVSVLECCVDDMTPQDVPVLIDRLLADGARDVFTETVQMKKGRPGFLITVLCDPQDEQRVAQRILLDSPSLGVRVRRDRRFEWRRDQVSVKTPWGNVSVKRALDASGRPLRAQPEFEDVRRIADEQGLSVDEVRRSARSAAEKETTGEAGPDAGRDARSDR